jgi:TRAP-type C4-dicarboxylate transport system substrate-binding protein
MNVRRACWAVAAIGLVTSLAACTGDDDAAPADPVTQVPAPADPAPEPTLPATVPPTTADASETLPDKSGATTAKPLTIRLLDENDDQAGEAAGLLEFARQVEELSDGSINVEIQWHGRESDDVFTATTQSVISGQADMAFVGNNYWAYEGVTTTQAAQAPLVIRSVEQGVAVAEDSELVQQLFGGLSDVGVVGLELFPENFKVLVDFDGTISSPADLAGSVVQSRAAPELFGFLEALGATAQQNPEGRNVYLAPPWIQHDWPQGTAVGNLPVYFVYFDLVANQEFWDGLDDGQRAVLTQAAAAAQDNVVANLPESGSAAEMAAYCERGSAVNTLAPESVAAFEAAARPVIDELAADPAASAVLDRIVALGDELEPTVYATCSAGNLGDPIAFPEGVFRFEVTEEDLERSDIDRDDWVGDTGVFTFTLRDGTFTWTQQSAAGAPGGGVYEGGGTYTVAGDHLTLDWSDTETDQPITAELIWEADGDGSLTFELVETSTPSLRFLYEEPWIRIGDA